jgi:Fe-S cluster biogenesis protein NfuA
VIDDLGQDPLVSSLLVLYGLHPLDFESRVLQAVSKVQPRVRKGGGEVQLLGIDGATVRLHLEVNGHSCGSTGNALKAMVEDAFYDAAPDLGELVIEGLEEQAGSSGFVPIAKVAGMVSAAPTAGIGEAMIVSER